MRRRELIMIAGAAAAATAALAAGCSTSSGETTDPQAQKREIDAGVDGALTDLYASAPGSRELVAKARGVLVFPRVVTAGLVIGGSYGRGALRRNGATTAYYSVGGGSVGVLAGADSKAMYLLFMTQEALAKFEESKGWTAGVDASVALLDKGADAHTDTKSAQAPVVGFVRTTAGFMANLSIDGAKFNKLSI